MSVYSPTQPKLFIRFDRVKRVVAGYTLIAMIVPNDMAGKKFRYDVLLLNRLNGRVHTIGREIPLKLANQLAVERVD